MYKSALCLLLILASGISAFCQTTESKQNVMTREVDYEVKLTNGSVQIVTVRYEANLAGSTKVTGDNASVLHPIDTRRYDLTISSAVDRMLVTNQRGDSVIDHRFDKQYKIDSRSESYQNFRFFAQTDRSAQIAQFKEQQGGLLQADLKNKLDQIIVKDESALVKALQTDYAAVGVKKVSK